MTEYRVREANISIHSPYSVKVRRRYLAEKKVRFLFWNFFYPVSNSEWRVNRDDAICDIYDDVELMKPCFNTKVDVSE